MTPNSDSVFEVMAMQQAASEARRYQRGEIASRFAASILGRIPHGHTEPGGKMIAVRAVGLADALLAELDRPKEPPAVALPVRADVGELLRAVRAADLSLVQVGHVLGYFASGRIALELLEGMLEVLSPRDGTDFVALVESHARDHHDAHREYDPFAPGGASDARKTTDPPDAGVADRGGTPAA